jgi:hypothetical protein
MPTRRQARETGPLRVAGKATQFQACARAADSGDAGVRWYRLRPADLAVTSGDVKGE